MKQFIRAAIIACCISLMWIGTASATSTWIGGSDELGPGTLNHQDTSDNVNWLVDHWTGDMDIPTNLTLLGKWEVDEKAWEDDDPQFSVFFDTKNSGTWTAPYSWDAETPIYFSVKAGSSHKKSNGGFELYYYDTAFYNASGGLQGLWDTLTLGGHDLSHISFWTAVPPEDPNPVPEPATMGLLGIGILALAAMRKRGFQK